MTSKIFKSIFISAIAVFLASFAVTFYFFYNHYNEQVRDKLRFEAEYVESGIENYGVDFIKTLPRGDVRLTLVSADGTVIYDSHLNDEDTLGMSNHIDREEIMLALSEGEGYSVRVSDTLSTKTVYYARRLESGDVLRISSAHLSVFSLLTRFLVPIILLTMIVALAVFIIARKLSDSIVRPINEMDLDSPQRTKVYDELLPIVNRISTQNYRIGRQVEEAKRRQSEFASITANMNEGMIVLNARAMILACNDSARRIFGVSDVPRSVLSLNDSHGFREAISKALSGSRAYYEIKTEDKHYSLSITPVVGDGAVDGAVIVIIDDTEKEEREVLRREFTSNVSHELKTPLTSISGYSELIYSGMADGEDARRFAKNISREAKRLISLVGDIIRLTQLDGGEIPYDGEIEPLHVARAVAERLTSVAEGAGVKISVEGDASRILGNEQILDEMIHNLVDNAIKYNKPDGEVRVSIRSVDSGTRITVSDTGIGIPPDKQDRVFERFYRVDKSHSRQIGGTGLGLSIVKHAAAYHKAEISLESEPGIGTSISVTFPKI